MYRNRVCMDPHWLASFPNEMPLETPLYVSSWRTKYCLLRFSRSLSLLVSVGGIKTVEVMNALGQDAADVKHVSQNSKSVISSAWRVWSVPWGEITSFISQSYIYHFLQELCLLRWLCYSATKACLLFASSEISLDTRLPLLKPSVWAMMTWDPHSSLCNEDGPQAACPPLPFALGSHVPRSWLSKIRLLSEWFTTWLFTLLKATTYSPSRNNCWLSQSFILFQISLSLSDSLYNVG